MSTPQEIQGKNSQFTKAYFARELCRFREIMCSTKYTQYQKEQAFSALGFVYFNHESDDVSVRWFVSTSQEFSRRTLWERLHPRTEYLASKGVSHGV